MTAVNMCACVLCRFERAIRRSIYILISMRACLYVWINWCANVIVVWHRHTNLFTNSIRFIRIYRDSSEFKRIFPMIHGPVKWQKKEEKKTINTNDTNWCDMIVAAHKKVDISYRGVCVLCIKLEFQLERESW